MAAAEKSATRGGLSTGTASAGANHAYRTLPGKNADYLTLIHYSLNIRITVLGYQNRADAIRALRAGEIDTVLTGLDTRPSVEEGIQLSASLVHSWPGLVTSLANVMAPLHSPQSTRVAVVEGYPDADFIHRRFRMPRLPITPIIRKR